MEAEGREAARVRAKEKEKARKGRAKARKADAALEALEAALADTGASAGRLEHAAAEVERTRRVGGEQAPEAVAAARRRAAEAHAHAKEASLDRLEEEMAEMAAGTSAAAAEEEAIGGGADALPVLVDGSVACCVCLTAAQTHAFMPCGHRCVCATCAELVMDTESAACVLCRQAARECVQIFIA